MPAAALARLLDTLATGDGEAAARLFADGGVYAHAETGDDLRWSLVISRGAQQIAAAVSARGAEPIEIVAWVTGASGCFAEGRVAAADAPGTRAVGGAMGDSVATALLRLQLHADGTVARALSFRCRVVEPPPGAYAQPGTPAPDVRPLVETYLEHLRENRFAEAAACFTADCTYSHPPYPGGTDRVLYRGREAVLHGFVHDRGPTPAQQIVTAFAQEGATGFVEGVVDGIPDGGTFVASFVVAPDGLLARYVACYGAPRVPPMSEGAGPSGST